MLDFYFDILYLLYRTCLCMSIDATDYIFYFLICKDIDWLVQADIFKQQFNRFPLNVGTQRRTLIGSLSHTHLYPVQGT